MTKILKILESWDIGRVESSRAIDDYSHVYKIQCADDRNYALKKTQPRTDWDRLVSLLTWLYSERDYLSPFLFALDRARNYGKAIGKLDAAKCNQSMLFWIDENRGSRRP